MNFRRLRGVERAVFKPLWVLTKGQQKSEKRLHDDHSSDHEEAEEALQGDSPSKSIS